MPPKTAAPSYLNTAITTWTGPLGLPDFASIEDRDFEAAFAAAFPAHLAEVEAIANEATARHPSAQAGFF
jgi:peptidyl-dipeptidase Dcp